MRQKQIGHVTLYESEDKPGYWGSLAFVPQADTQKLIAGETTPAEFAERERVRLADIEAANELLATKIKNDNDVFEVDLTRPRYVTWQSIPCLLIEPERMEELSPGSTKNANDFVLDIETGDPGYYINAELRVAFVAEELQEFLTKQVEAERKAQA